MNRFIFAFLVATSATTTTYAAGGASTGGGGAFVCRNAATGKVESSELLDLWEGRAIAGWNINDNDNPVDLQVGNALIKLKAFDSSLYERVQREMLLIRKSAKYFPVAVSFPAPADANPRYSKTGCPLEGMMLYDGDYNRLSVASETFSHLVSNTNIAAAWVHESIYKVLRDVMKQQDSVNSRKLTACLFSTDDCLGSSGFAVPNTAQTYECKSANQDFFIYPSNNAWTIRYLRIGSRFFGGLISRVWDPAHSVIAQTGELAKFGYVSVDEVQKPLEPRIILRLGDGSVLTSVIPSTFTILGSDETVESEDAVCSAM